MRNLAAHSEFVSWRHIPIYVHLPSSLLWLYFVLICALLSKKCTLGDLGSSLREICAANRTEEKQVISWSFYQYAWFTKLLGIVLESSLSLLYLVLQQIMALLKSVGTSFCPNYMDWFGIESSESPSRNADRSVVSKFLQTRPADFSTTKLQVWFSFATYFLKTKRNWEGKTGNF